MIRIILIGLFLTSLSCSAQTIEEPKKLIFNFGPHSSAPYAITDGRQIIGGIIWDIANVLSSELNVQASFVSISRKREAKYVEEGKTDIILNSNPNWLSNKDKLIWSKPLFKTSDILVILAESKVVVNSKQDLNGLGIGTIRGYKYPLLEEGFTQNYIERHDVKELGANFEKLLVARIDAFVDSSLLVNYQLSKREDAHRFKIAPFVISKHQIYAAISPKSTVDPQKIVTALEKLKQNGVFEAILQKYK